MRPLILDISFWQDNPETKFIVDFGKMKASGATGVILRVGQGNWEDKKIKEFWALSEGKGLYRGGYWYYDNSVSPYVQARKCYSIIKDLNLKFELPFFADFEDRRIELAYHGWKNWSTFIDELRRLEPTIKIGIYTGHYYWEENKPKGLDFFRNSYFAKFPLWIAQYPYSSHVQESLYVKPLFPKTWSNWMLWQVSDRGDGNLFGVESSRVDINYFNGTMEDFKKTFGLVDEPENVPSDKPVLLSRKMEIKYLNNVISYKQD